MEKPFYNKTDLKGFGFTPKMVLQLGEPCKTKVVRFYSRNVTVCYFSKDRVEEYLSTNSDLVQQVLTKRRLRREKAIAEYKEKLEKNRQIWFTSYPSENIALAELVWFLNKCVKFGIVSPFFYTLKDQWLLLNKDNIIKGLFVREEISYYDNKTKTLYCYHLIIDDKPYCFHSYLRVGEIVKDEKGESLDSYLGDFEVEDVGKFLLTPYDAYDILEVELAS